MLYLSFLIISEFQTLPLLSVGTSRKGGRSFIRSFETEPIISFPYKLSEEAIKNLKIQLASQKGWPLIAKDHYCLHNSFFLTESFLVLNLHGILSANFQPQMYSVPIKEGIFQKNWNNN